MSAELAAAPPASEPSDEELLDRDSVMRAIWWSVCQGCGGVIHGGQHCCCYETHIGDVQGLTAVNGRSVWACRSCYLAAQPT